MLATEKKFVSIAIDGASGAGKSTLSKMLAKELGYIYVDTGALYRAFALYLLKENINIKDEYRIKQIIDNNKVKLEIKYIKGEQHVFVNNKDESGNIRTPEVSMAASRISALSMVRSFLFDTQKNLAKTNNVIMDGRDIGTVVLPRANIKIYLTASSEARAKRRLKELNENGINVTYEEVLSDMNKRDYNDSHRSVAPLLKASDAIVVDTTNLTLDGSFIALKNIIKDRIG